MILVVFALVYAMGWHRHVSLETLVRNRAFLDNFIAGHFVAALAIFIGIYITAVALSVPGAVVLTISSGILFGVIVGGLASVIGATIGATIIFLIAKTALGEHLAQRAGPLATKLAEGFREDAFSYLLFLRLVPAFPFFAGQPGARACRDRACAVRGRDRARDHSGDLHLRVRRRRPRQRDCRARQPPITPASPPAMPVASWTSISGRPSRRNLSQHCPRSPCLRSIPLVVKRLRSRARVPEQSG